jgi:hypothetical protein
VDLISTSEVHVSMAIEDGYGGGGEGMGKRLLERLVGELRKCGTVGNIFPYFVVNLTNCLPFFFLFVCSI